MNDSPFVFERYGFNAADGVLHLHYRYEDGPAFDEIIAFSPVKRVLAEPEQAALDKALRLVFLLAGVSYYKAHAPKHLMCEAFQLDAVTAAFMTKVYRHGLGEFAYQNKLDLSDRIKFAVGKVKADKAVKLSQPRRSLVPVGGGKDSIVTIECLKQAGEPVTLYAQGRAGLGIAAPIAATIKTSGLPVIAAERTLAPKLMELNKSGALNGHVPITAILSSIAIACTILHGFDRVIMSNEHSASAPNIRKGDVEINHQYSKSFAFEKDFADYIASHISPDLSYFSLLRPLTEADIARRFAKLIKYHSVFRSCNAGFRQDAGHVKDWCCNCPKCRFVFLALAPFTGKEALTKIFGKDLLNDPAQQEGFAELCGLSAHKPFECVGEIEESALLMEKLYRGTEWKNDAVVQNLGATLANKTKDFDKKYETLFAMKKGHRVPEHYLRMLDAGR